MSRRDLRPLLFAALVAVAWAVLQSVEGVDAGFLALAPALLLALPLLAGRYVGEERIVRWAAARRSPRQLRPRTVPLPRAPRDRVTHGGLLLGRRLAGRAPPAPTAA